MKRTGDWKTTGEAFGPGPARGTLPNQMEVSGFEGKGLVNSYFQGDGTTGTLTSPPLKIERKYINFLLGGGMHPASTCINLLVDGKVVHTATGPNDKAGGTERLDWHSWDVSAWAGKQAVIQIEDQETGGWGHINIDHIVQSDRRREWSKRSRTSRSSGSTSASSLAPARAAGPQISLQVDGETVRQAVGQGRDKPYWITWDVSRLKGQRGQLKVAELPLPDGTCPLAESVVQGDQSQGALIVVDRLYQRDLPAAVPLLTDEELDERPQRAGVLRGRVPPLLPAQPVGHQLGQHDLGSRRQPGPGPLAATGPRHLSGQVGHDLLRLRGRRRE